MSWTIQETGYSLNITYIGALSATCSDGSILSPINYGYNGTNAAFCNGALRQPQTVPTPDGNITARCNALSRKSNSKWVAKVISPAVNTIVM